MDNIGDYPLGADNRRDAPWKIKKKPEREIDVLVSVTLSKSLKIKVSDYKILNSGKDEDGEYSEDIDYSDCNLKLSTEVQKILPQYAYIIIENLYRLLKFSDKENKCDVYDDRIQSIISDLREWNVDELEVIKE